MDSSSSRRRATNRDLQGVGDGDLEEGEYVPGVDSDSDTTNEDDRFDRLEADDDEQHPQRMRRLDDIIKVGSRAGAAAPAPAPLPVPVLPASPTLSSESDEGTISDHRSPSSGGSGGRPEARRNFTCHVCGKEFTSRKAVDGHMRVHGSGGGGGSGSGGARHLVSQPAPFTGGWAATGRRGCTGGRPSAAAAVSLNSESTGQSTAIVEVPQVQQQPLEPVPMAFAVTINLSPLPSSTRTNLSGVDDEGSSASATATAQPMHCDAAAAAAVVTGANPSSTGAAAGAGAGARAAAGLVDDQLAAAADQAPPVPQVRRQAVSVPPPAAQPLVPPPPAAPVQLQQGGQLVPPPLPRPDQPQREYSCKLCGKTYPTHQGLGGHAAGHRNRQREEEAMAAAAAGVMMQPNGGGDLGALRRGRKSEQQHACQKCNKVFATGVALGGHMRMHYTGPPIVHKSKKRCVTLFPAGTRPPPPAVTEADLRLALSTAIARIEAPSTSAAPAAAGTGILRLFGFDIGLLRQQAPPSEQQGSGSGAPSEQQEEGSGSGSGSGTTEEGGSSSAGEQQKK